MGILVVWSWKTFSSKFSILSDLLRNLKLAKIKLCSFFPGQQLTYMKNYFDTIEELPTGSHLKKFKNWCQNAYGCKTNYKFIFGPFFFTEQTLRSIPADVLPNATENVIRPYQNLSRRLSLNGNFANVKTLMGILVVWSLNFCVLRTKTQFRNIQPFNLPIYFEVSKWVKFIGRSRRKSVPRVCPPNHKLERVPRLLDSQIITWVKPLTIIRAGIIG